MRIALFGLILVLIISGCLGDKDGGSIDNNESSLTDESSKKAGTQEETLESNATSENAVSEPVLLMSNQTDVPIDSEAPLVTFVPQPTESTTPAETSISEPTPKPALPPQGPISRVTLGFYDHINLETGEIFTLNDVAEAGKPIEYTLMAVYVKDRPIHSLILQNRDRSMEIAHITDTSFAYVGTEDVLKASFTYAPVDESFDSNRVVLIRDGAKTYKLGNPAEDEQGVTFDYALIEK